MTFAKRRSSGAIAKQQMHAKIKSNQELPSERLKGQRSIGLQPNLVSENSPLQSTIPLPTGVSLLEYKGIKKAQNFWAAKS